MRAPCLVPWLLGRCWPRSHVYPHPPSSQSTVRGPPAHLLELEGPHDGATRTSTIAPLAIPLQLEQVQLDWGCGLQEERANSCAREGGSQWGGGCGGQRGGGSRCEGTMRLGRGQQVGDLRGAGVEGRGGAPTSTSTRHLLTSVQQEGAGGVGG